MPIWRSLVFLAAIFRIMKYCIRNSQKFEFYDSTLRIRLKCFRSSDWSCCQFLIEIAVMKFLESFEFRFVQSVFLWFVHSSISHQFHFLRFLKIFTKSSFLLILGYSSQKVLFKTKDSIGFYTDFCHVIIHVRGCSSLLFTALSVCINCTCWSYLIKTNITTLKITGCTLFRYVNGEKRRNPNKISNSKGYKIFR